MQRIVNIAKSKEEADEYDIKQHIGLTPAERRKIAKKLKIRFYGKKTIDVKEAHRKNV